MHCLYLYTKYKLQTTLHTLFKEFIDNCKNYHFQRSFLSSGTQRVSQFIIRRKQINCNTSLTTVYTRK